MNGKYNFALWSIRFIFFVSSVFACSNFNVSKNYEIVRYPIIRVYGIILVLTASAYYLSRYESSARFYNDSNGQLTLIFFEYNFYWFVSVTTFALNIANHNRIAKWYALMTGIIFELERSKLDILAVALLTFYVVDLCILSVYVPLSFTARSQPDMSIKAYVVYYTLCGASAITILQITTGLSFLTFVFADLRIELSRTFTESVSTRCKSEKLKDIVRKYQQYCSLAFDFNKYFSMQILLLTLLLFTELTYSSFYVIKLFDTADDNLFLDSDSKLTFSFCFFAFYFVQLIEYAGLGELLADELNKLAILTTSAFSGDFDGMQDILEIFIIQGANLNLEITAANFFKVDHGLIFRMIGLVSSTTVMLLQFDSISVENCCNKNATMKS